MFGRLIDKGECKFAEAPLLLGGRRRLGARLKGDWVELFDRRLWGNGSDRRLDRVATL